jgi:hypothetical protein
MYYRARYYAQSLGRFISADTIVPDPNAPQSLNRYSYVTNNPLRYTDATGHCGGDENDQNNPDYDCWKKLREIEGKYSNVSVNRDWWNFDELVILMKSLDWTLNFFNNNMDAFKSGLGHMRFNRNVGPGGLLIAGQYWQFSGDITIFNSAFQSEYDAIDTIIHEMGHAFDFAGTYKNGLESWFVPNKSFTFIGAFWDKDCQTTFGICAGMVQPLIGRLWAPGIQPSGTPFTTYAKKNSAEDFAETFAAMVISAATQTPASGPSSVVPRDSQRTGLMDALVSLAVQGNQ